MRIRYPVMPLHDSGNNMYKEIKALSDMTLRKNKYAKLYPDVRVDNGTIEEVSYYIGNLFFGLITISIGDTTNLLCIYFGIRRRVKHYKKNLQIYV